jgi:hypothetical protein
MIHQIGRKLREQIHKFSGELSRGLCKARRRFVEEMIYGIQARGSVRLTEVSRALDEPISLKKTEERLSNNLADPMIREVLGDEVLSRGSSRIKDDSLLILDPSDLCKKYAKKMEYLAEVHDGSEEKIGNGYWLCEVVGCDVGSSEITPLSQSLWSQKAPGFVSENDEILKLVRRVYAATQRRGIFVIDRGGDRRELYKELVGGGCRFLIRQRGDRHLLYKGRPIETIKLARFCSLPYAETVVKEKDGEEKVYTLEFGYLPVRLPEWPDVPLWLVVVKGFGKEPMLLLTTERMRKARKILWWAVESYLTRWKVEETIRFIKQSYDFEDIRVLTYDRIQNLAMLVFACSYFSAVWLGTKAKLRILAAHALKSAKRLFGTPDFRYYAISDGIKEILWRAGQGTLYPRGVDPLPHPQLDLFDT